MTDIEQLLQELDSPPPVDLERSTLTSVGAADLAARTDSPFGDMWVAWSTRGITAVSPRFTTERFDDFESLHRRGVYETGRLPGELAEAVTAGLNDGQTVGLPIDFSGIGDFQRSVLTVCASIPDGAVHPYGWIADEIDNPGAVRAVGTALARNPIPLLVPCHRVVKSDGSLGNYAFGVDMKRQLLIREGAILA